MEQETYYRYAEEAVERVVFILHLVLLILHQASYVALRSLVGRWSGVSVANVTSIVETARAKMKRMLDAVHHLLFVLRWIRALGEIALLHAEDLTVFIRRRQNQFGSLRCRRIDDLPYQDCYTWFGHYPHNLRRLHRQLRVPQSFTEPRSLQMFSGEECFLVYLYHLTKGAPFMEMARFVFGGDPRRLSEMNYLFISHAYYSFYNKISGSSLDQWVPRSLNTCRRLIYDALLSDAIEEVEFNDGEVVDRRRIPHHFDFSSFHIFWFP